MWSLFTGARYIHRHEGCMCVVVWGCVEGWTGTADVIDIEEGLTVVSLRVEYVSVTQ